MGHQRSATVLASWSILAVTTFGLHQTLGQDNRTGVVPLPERAARSVVIAYATVDTNKAPDLTLIIADIWKGKEDARSAGITNGLRIPFDGDPKHLSKRRMDATVLFFDRLPGELRLFSTYAVYDGRLGVSKDSLTTNDFKAKFCSGTNVSPSTVKPH